MLRVFFRMAFLQLTFWSEALAEQRTLWAVVPQTGPGANLGRRRPVLYLLHGRSDDHTIWLRRTAIERYADAAGVAVIMPGVGRSWYLDTACGQRFGQFMAVDLPRVAADFLPITDDPAQTFVGGLSMGGYGAFRQALLFPERYAAAFSFSGALNIEWAARRSLESPLLEVEARGIFGDAPVAGGPADLFALLRQRVAEGAALPKLYQCCGTADFLYQDNLAFRALAQELGVELTYEEHEGAAHTWDYWDRQVEHVLANWLPLPKTK